MRHEGEKKDEKIERMRIKRGHGAITIGAKDKKDERQESRKRMQHHRYRCKR